MLISVISISFSLGDNYTLGWKCLILCHRIVIVKLVHQRDFYYCRQTNSLLQAISRGIKSLTAVVIDVTGNESEVSKSEVHHH